MKSLFYTPLGPYSVFLDSLTGKVAHIIHRPYTDKVRVTFTGLVYYEKFEVKLPDGTTKYIGIEEALT